MARSVSITRPPKRQPHLHDAPRPVLQLPLERPVWREPPEREQPESDRERGVVVIDFYI
jgi:hypothetical protein